MPGDDELVIRAVLETTAILSYARGQVHVGELLVEVADEGACVGLPTVALLDAYSRVGDDVQGRARIEILAATPGIVVLPLGPREAAAISETVSRLGSNGSAVADYDLARAHAAWAATAHSAYYLTCQPRLAPAVLARWQIHYIAPDDT